MQQQPPSKQTELHRTRLALQQASPHPTHTTPPCPKPHWQLFITASTLDICQCAAAPPAHQHHPSATQPHLQLFICALTSLLLRTRPWITVGSGASPPPPAAPPASAPDGSAAMAPGAGRLTVVKQMLYSCGAEQQVRCGTSGEVACQARQTVAAVVSDLTVRAVQMVRNEQPGWLIGCRPDHGCSTAL
jgi:hypothetical protein